MIASAPCSRATASFSAVLAPAMTRAPIALMSITSWPGPGVGGATSSSLRSSTGPHARQITALINPEEYTGEAPCGGRDTDADCGGSSSRQRRSTTIEPVRVYMRVPGTQPMPQLVRLVQDIEAAGFDGVGILDS